MIEENRLKLINSFKRFKNTQIWKMIVDNLNQDLKECQDRIETIGGDREKIYTDRDLAILQKNDIIRLVNFPDEQISNLESYKIAPNSIENTLDDDFLDEAEEDFNDNF